MIKSKTKQFADKLIADPTKTQTDAYLEVHPEATKATARARASELLAKPEVQIYMEKHVDKAKQTIVGLLDSDKEEMRFKASEHITAYAYGKPVTKSNNINFNINVEQALDNLI